jgi:hypothetical protein
VVQMVEIHLLYGGFHIWTVTKRRTHMDCSLWLRENRAKMFEQCSA